MIEQGRIDFQNEKYNGRKTIVFDNIMGLQLTTAVLLFFPVEIFLGEDEMMRREEVE